jgi:hypothetical protein
VKRTYFGISFNSLVFALKQKPTFRIDAAVAKKQAEELEEYLASEKEKVRITFEMRLGMCILTGK